jgi:hypothetical protein
VRQGAWGSGQVGEFDDSGRIGDGWDDSSYVIQSVGFELCRLCSIVIIRNKRIWNERFADIGDPSLVVREYGAYHGVCTRVFLSITIRKNFSYENVVCDVEARA